MRICNVYYDKIVYIIAIIQGYKLLKVTEFFLKLEYAVHISYNEYNYFFRRKKL